MAGSGGFRSFLILVSTILQFNFKKTLDLELRNLGQLYWARIKFMIRDYSKHLCLPPLLPRRLSFMGTVCFG